MAWTAGEQFPPPSGLLAAFYLSCPLRLAGTAGCTRSFFYSLSPPRPPAATSPLFPREWGGWALTGIWFLNKTKTGSVTRASSDRLMEPLFVKLALRDRVLGCWRVGGTRQEDGEGLGRAGTDCLSSFPSWAAESPLYSTGAFLLHVSRGQRKYSITPRVI